MSYIRTLGQDEGTINAGAVVNIDIPQGDPAFSKPLRTQPGNDYNLNITDAEVDKRIYQDVYTEATQVYRQNGYHKAPVKQNLIEEASSYVDRNPQMGVILAITIGVLLTRIF